MAVRQGVRDDNDPRHDQLRQQVAESHGGGIGQSDLAHGDKPPHGADTDKDGDEVMNRLAQQKRKAPSKA